MSNQPPPHKGSPSKSQHRDKGGGSTGPRFRKNTGGNSNNHNGSPNTNNQGSNDTASSGANNAGTTGVISVHGSPAPQHQNLHQQHVQQAHQHTRTQSPRTPHASAPPPPRMVQSTSTSNTHSPSISYANSPNLIHSHTHVATLHAYSPQPGYPQNIPHSSHSPHPNHSPHPAHPNHSPVLSRAGHSPNIGHAHSPHFHAHSPSLQASSYFPPTRTPTFMQVHPHPHHVYPSPSPRQRPMSMHSGMGIGLMPGTPVMTYVSGGISGGMNMSLNANTNTGPGGTGTATYDGSPMRMSAPEMASPSANVNNTNNTIGSGAHQDQSAAFNLCRRRIVAPGIEGQSSTFAASIDPELAGVAVRVVNPQPLLLPNGFLWEFEIPRGMVPASLTNAILNVTQTAIPLLLESRPADTCARGEHTARIYMPPQCLETYPGWEEKRAEWIAERAELHTWHGRIPDVAGSHISSSNRTGKPSAVWVCKSQFPDLSERSEREVLVIARTAIQGGSVDWAQMVCRRAMPPARTLLPHGESQLKMWILRALSTLVLQGVEVVEWSYEFLVTEQQFWWVYRGQSPTGGVPDLSELDRGEPIPDSI